MRSLSKMLEHLAVGLLLLGSVGLETMAFAEVEVEQATAKFTADGREYPAGSYVIRLQQPYSAFAKTMLERQQYPDLRLYPGGPPKRPYDVTAQTLPLLMGVTTDTIKDRFSASLVPCRKMPQSSVSHPMTCEDRSLHSTCSCLRFSGQWAAGLSVRCRIM